MNVKFVTSEFQKQTLPADTNFSDEWKSLLLQNGARQLIYRSGDYDYLEQLVTTEGFSFAQLDFKVAGNSPAIAFPMADEAMIVIVFMLKGSVPGELFGYGPVALIDGFCYMFYLPAGVTHSVSLQSGHTQVAYSYLSQKYIRELLAEDSAIAGFLEQFSIRSEIGLIGKPVSIDPKLMGFIEEITKPENTDGGLKMDLRINTIGLIRAYLQKANVIENNVHDQMPGSLTKSKKLFYIKELLDDYKGGKLEIKQLAAIVNIREHQLEKGFKKTFGTPIITYLNRKKISFAKALLLETDMSIKSIAEKLGYTDQGGLSKLFKSYKVASPRQFRTSARKFMRRHK